MKDTDHHMRHPRGHLGDRASAQGTRGCAWRDDQFGRGQNTVLGWSDPTLGHCSVPKVMLGVAPAHEDISPNFLPACVAGIWMKQVKEQGEDGKNCPLHFQNCQLLHPMLGLGSSSSSVCNDHLCESHRARKVESGGSDPTLDGFQPPKVLWGRSRPSLRKGESVLAAWKSRRMQGVLQDVRQTT